jgi:hypothetical protein
VSEGGRIAYLRVSHLRSAVNFPQLWCWRCCNSCRERKGKKKQKKEGGGDQRGQNKGVDFEFFWVQLLMFTSWEQQQRNQYNLEPAVYPLLIVFFFFLRIMLVVFLIKKILKNIFYFLKISISKWTRNIKKN